VPRRTRFVFNKEVPLPQGFGAQERGVELASARRVIVPMLRRKWRAPSADRPPQTAPRLTVATYNVHKCVGVDGRFDPERIMRVIEELGADLVALQEVDQRFGSRAGLLDLRRLEKECGLRPVPIAVSRASHGWRGNLLLVRDGEVLTARQLALPGAEPRGALVVDLDLRGRRLRVVAAHLGLLRRSRASQIRFILEKAGAFADGATLLMGDLNEWRLGERSSLARLEPAFGPMGAAIASFPSRFPVWSLDRILTRPANSLLRVEAHDSELARLASDHLPLKGVLALPGPPDSVAEPPAEQQPAAGRL
jgi:endonuclease/exonuclease/phosphatase family metal-dependent hydrolase